MPAPVRRCAQNANEKAYSGDAAGREILRQLLNDAQVAERFRFDDDARILCPLCLSRL